MLNYVESPLFLFTRPVCRCQNLDSFPQLRHRKVTQIYPDQFTQLHHEGKDGKARLWALQSTICGFPAMKSATAAEGKSWHASPLVVSVYCPLWVAFSYWGTEASLVSQNGQPFCGSRSASISVSYLRQVDLWPDLHPCTSLYSMSQNDV